MKIIVDAMGGDNAPKEIVLGAVDALNADADLKVTLVGKRDEIEDILSSCAYKKDSVDIIDASEVITNDDSPMSAMRTKKDSSLVKALDALINDDEAGAIVSAGSTGATLMGAVTKVKRIKGVVRPALAPMLPTLTGGQVVLCDCGANLDCRPINLVQFAIMASAYAKAMLGIDSPRVGLLNNGVEEHKGVETVREAYKALKDLQGINFVGNCEARDILSGNYDVVVADGFNGNIALKSTEGAANAVLKILKESIFEGGARAKLGALMLKPVFKQVKNRLDYNSHGGACFLGVKKVVVKSHGSSKRKSISASILQAKELVDKNICADIERGISAYADEQEEE